MRFAKMQGVGNDFVVISADEVPETTDLAQLARRVCERRRGIGADGLLLATCPDDADVGMRIFNADGSEDTMCGNGLRCLIRWAADRGRIGTAGVARTLAGPIAFRLWDDERVTLELGPPRFAAAAVPVRLPERGGDGRTGLSIDGQRLLAVNTGSTHAVAFVDALPGDALFFARSPRIETDPSFPERTSLMWCAVEAPDALRLRIWERGVGETLGCGTGACAAAVLARATRRVAPVGPLAVCSRGGVLEVDWDGGDGDPIFLTGEGRLVFAGTMPA